MAITFSDKIYPKQLELYNSAHRSVIGAMQSTCGDPANSDEKIKYNQQFYFTGAHYDLLTLDASDTDASTPKVVNLFTLANGAKISLSYYGTINGINVVIEGKFCLYDKDNNFVRWYPNDYGPYKYISAFQSGWQNQELSSFDIRYYPPSYYYSGSTIKEGINHVYAVLYTGLVIGYENQTVYTPDDLQGAVNTWTGSNFARTRKPTCLYAFNDNDWSTIYDEFIDSGDGSIISPILPSEDTSTQGGGDSANPDYNPFSDPINFPDLPTGGSALASGFIKLYRPTSGELNQLAAKLWSDSFIEEIKKIQNDPLEAIISLHSVPFGIVGASRQSCRIGNYDSEITMDTIGAQFYTVDCGNISIPEHWASALDYAPYTDIEIYLPFCGVKPLQIDDVMNRVLNVKYNIDILTGAAICMVKCGDSVLYTYNTEIAQNIPINASNHAQLYQSIISAASAVVGVASGGAGAVVGAVQSAATVAASKHSQVSRGGSLGGSVGVLGDFVPYLIIHRPIQSLAADFAHKKGYPSNITATLSSVSGYTEVDRIHLENIPCTDMEREELLRILQEGVIL